MPGGTQYRVGRFDVDVEARRISVGSVPVDLGYRSFEALKALIEAGGSVVDRDALHRRLWPDTVVDETSLNKCVSDLRKALADHDAAEYVETVRGRGYRLAVASEPVVAASTVPARGAAWPRWRLAIVGGLAAAALGVAVVGEGGDPAEQVAELRAEARLLYQQREYSAASERLRRAIELDPGYGEIYGQLAHVVHRMRDVTTEAGLSLDLAEEGVELAPGCAECRGTLGFFLFYHHWEWRRAREQYEEALRIDPDNHSIRQSYAHLLAATGESDEAVRQAQAAAEAAPLSTDRHASLAQVLYVDGRYEDAIDAANRAIGLDRRRNEAWEYRMRAQLALGRLEEAVHTMIAERYKHHADAVGEAVAEGGGAAGIGKLLEVTGGWPERSEVSWRRAAWHAVLDDDDAALAALEDAVAQRNINLMFTAVDPLYSRLRGHPRFQALMEEMGFEPELTARAANSEISIP